MIGLLCSEEIVTLLNCFNTILERDGQTDGWTEFLYQYRGDAQ